MRVFVVDDDDIARELLASTLRKAGHIVLELSSAIGVTREIVTHNPDVIVLDLMMPSLDGDKLTRIVRSHSAGKALGIVLVSSRPLEELEETAIAVDADAVVNKRAIRDQLSAAVERAHQRASGRTHTAPFRVNRLNNSRQR